MQECSAAHKESSAALQQWYLQQRFAPICAVQEPVCSLSLSNKFRYSNSDGPWIKTIQNPLYIIIIFRIFRWMMADDGRWTSSQIPRFVLGSEPGEYKPVVFRDGLRVDFEDLAKEYSWGRNPTCRSLKGRGPMGRCLEDLQKTTERLWKPVEVENQ